MKVVGRNKEIKRLTKIVKSSKSEFVAVYGRRRIGKTFLIREFFNYQFDFQLTGLANATTEQQLTNFHTSLLRQTDITFLTVPKDWLEAFQRLIQVLEEQTSKGKKKIFFDELPWLDTTKSDFLMALEHFWNSWASNRKDIILIACGSAASWMINKIINNHGGLHNRVTQRIKLDPFTLAETEIMLKAKNLVLDQYQILQIYMVMGGVPFYLDALTTGESAAQNIEKLCFRKNALLVSEYKNLFASLFKNSTSHEAVVAALAQYKKGLTRNELLTASQLPSGGTATKILVELEESGFISRYTPLDKKIKSTLYRLSDFYCLFYHRFIKNNKNYSQGVWVNAIDHPKHRTWSGYAFEQICMEHIPQIKSALGISGILTNNASWKSTNDDEKGAQIDLIIDRRDQVINICEMKFSIHPFIVDKAYASNLRNKLAVFKNETKTRKALFLTMITTFGVKENQHSTSLIQNSLTMEDLFKMD